MGVKIDINVDDLRLDDDRLSRAHATLGKISYNNYDEGELLYIKASMTGNEPEYVNEYRAANPDFPHQTTADQFFDEVQFECYRAVGYKVADDLFGRAKRQRGGPDEAEELPSDFEGELDLMRLWLRPLLPSSDDFLTVQRQRADVERRLATERSLGEYSKELVHAVISDLDAAKQKKAPVPPAGWGQDQLKLFQAVNEQMQLMERTVIRLRLSDPANQTEPRNRGWMNLFRTWSQTPSFQAIWVISIANYSAALKVFCEEALGLRLRVKWESAKPGLLQRLGTGKLKPEEEGKLTNREKKYLRMLIPDGADDKAVRVSDPKRAVVLFASVRAKRRGVLLALEPSREIPDRLQVGFAVFSIDPKAPKNPPVLVSFRVRDTFRGMRLSSHMIAKLRECKPAGHKSLAFWFGPEDNEATRVLRPVLIRHGFEEVQPE